MSFEFSQNLLADIGSTQSPKSSQTLHPSSSMNPPATSQLCKSQSFISQVMPYSQNLLDMSDNSLTQMTVNLSQPLRSLSQQPSLTQHPSLNNSAKGSFVQNRVPASRLNLTPESTSINVNVARALKQVQSRLEDFPVIVSRMLEEGLDYVEKDFKATRDINEDRLKKLLSTLADVMRKVQDEDQFKMFTDTISSMSETLETLKKDKAKYLDLIDKLQMIIDKQKKIIVKLKEEKFIIEDQDY